MERVVRENLSLFVYLCSAMLPWKWLRVQRQRRFFYSLYASVHAADAEYQKSVLPMHASIQPLKKKKCLIWDVDKECSRFSRRPLVFCLTCRFVFDCLIVDASVVVSLRGSRSKNGIACGYCSWGSQHPTWQTTNRRYSCTNRESVKAPHWWCWEAWLTHLQFWGFWLLTSVCLTLTVFLLLWVVRKVGQSKMMLFELTCCRRTWWMIFGYWVLSQTCWMFCLGEWWEAVCYVFEWVVAW